MQRRLAHCLRAFVLVVTVAFPLAGQEFASASMAMAMETGNDSISDKSATLSNMCPGCGGMDHSQAVPSDCMIGMCAGVNAILPATVFAEDEPFAAFPVVGQGDGQGLTIPPPLGPPKAFHSA
jgi:hypothetical protein